MRKIVLLLAVVTLAVYFNTLSHTFVGNERFAIAENNSITHIRHIPKIFVTDFYHSHAEKNTVEHSNYYRPIQTLSFLLDYHIWKLNPFGFHLSNVLLHLTNGILVFITIFLICKSRIISLFTSILFIVHPVQTCAVAYLTVRSEILVCFFILISFIFYLLYRSIAPSDRLANSRNKLDSPANRIADRKGLLYSASVAGFMLALLSKESAVVFPFILIFYDITFTRYKKVHMGKNRYPALFKRYSAYLIVDIVYIALRLSILNFTPEKKIFQSATSLYRYLLTMPHTLMEYISLLAYPTNLHMEREATLATSALQADVVLSLLGIMFLIFLVFVCYRRSPTIFFGIAWFIIFLIPVSSILPINTLMAEHWLYIPSIGFFLLASVLFLKLQSIKVNYNLILILFVLLAVLCSYKTMIKNRDWRNDFIRVKVTPQE